MRTYMKCTLVLGHVTVRLRTVYMRVIHVHDALLHDITQNHSHDPYVRFPFPSGVKNPGRWEVVNRNIINEAADGIMNLGST